MRGGSNDASGGTSKKLFRDEPIVVLTGMRILLLFTAAIAAAQVPVFIPPTTFISNGSSVTGPSTYWTAAADFNRDGRLDLAAADNRVSSNMLGFVVALSQPGGGYSAPVSFPVGL
jgi:hypothetical protein